jgi:very-short-patch-repair endonuclease
MPDNRRKPLTRNLRQRMTDAETRLWFLLRDRRLMGVKFRRQFPIDPYVVDFYCHELGLIVEVDGGQHLENLKDEQRTRALEQHGYAVLRFWNDEVLKHQDGVLEKIRETLLGRAPSPAASRRPLPEGEANNNTGVGA